MLNLKYKSIVVKWLSTSTFLALLPWSLSVAIAAPTETVFLSGTDKDHTVAWDFRITSGRKSGVWSTIPVPSNWETKGFGTYTTGWTAAPNEKGLYKRSFTAPLAWRGQNISLIFEGSMTDTAVQINGVSAGPIHQGGFYRFKYDVTGLLQLGKPNLLEVTVSKNSADASVNRAEAQGDYWFFGGIYRPVYLEIKPAQSIERTAINATSDGSFAADIYLNGVSNAERLTAQIQDLNGKAIGPTFSVRLPPNLPNGQKVTLTSRTSEPRLWTAETPNLYQVQVKLLRGRQEIHRTTQRFGFRTIEVRAGDGIYVNGHKIVLKGANRHSFWPTSGRTSSPGLSRADILLMKEMNMNAVRMSHYPPERHFLDLCDELGLYVLDELAGWQKKYDTPVGEKLVREMVTFDVNHPSILFWDNGNEGGWNTDLDDDFALYDPQKRQVLHPWALFSGVQTDHYESYESTRQYLNGEKGKNLFLPTEFLHGLYDGGAGAGLNDYWNLTMASPLGAGGFLWAYLDEGLVRDDRGGSIDVVGNNYPDGIVGPFRQKEGSFYTIKDIWSPLQLVDRESLASPLPANFNGKVEIANNYAFTDAQKCRFNWQLIKFALPWQTQTGHSVVASGNAAVPAIAPGARGTLSLRLPANWRDADALTLTASDSTGREISAWRWSIKNALDVKNSILPLTPARTARATSNATASEDASLVTMQAGATLVSISKATGQLIRVMQSGKAYSLANGPSLAAGNTTLVSLRQAQEGDVSVVRASYSGNLSNVTWRLHPSGWLELSYKYNLSGPQDFMGVSFTYPEKQVKGVKWLGKGPYRVWKNRMRGVATDVWQKSYNDTATGADTWQYPEFKGYHANTYWAQLQTTEGLITVATPQENLFLRLYTPRNGSDPRTAAGIFPLADISFLDGIPAVGNKFQAASDTGPEGQQNNAVGDYDRTLFFYFGDLKRTENH